MITYSMIVYGRVQGVGFRFYVQRQAKLLGVTGWVRNKPDGSVEILAQGKQPQLQKLIDAVHQGSPASKVEDVKVTEIKDTKRFHTFRVRY